MSISFPQNSYFNRWCEIDPPKRYSNLLPHQFYTPYTFDNNVLSNLLIFSNLIFKKWKYDLYYYLFVTHCLPCKLLVHVLCLCLCGCVLSCFSHVWFCVTPWTVAHGVLCPWDSPGKNTGVDCHALLRGIFPTQGSNAPHIYLHWQVCSLPPTPPGKPVLLLVFLIYIQIIYIFRKLALCKMCFKYFLAYPIKMKKLLYRIFFPYC